MENPIKMDDLGVSPFMQTLMIPHVSTCVLTHQFWGGLLWIHFLPSLLESVGQGTRPVERSLQADGTSRSFVDGGFNRNPNIHHQHLQKLAERGENMG